MISIDELNYLPKASLQPYNGTPSQGHPDEAKVNGILSGKHWTALDSGELASKLSFEVPLIKPEDLAVLLPAFLLAAIRVHLECLENLYHYTDSLTLSINSRGLTQLLRNYSRGQISEVLVLINKLNETRFELDDECDLIDINSFAGIGDPGTESKRGC